MVRGGFTGRGERAARAAAVLLLVAASSTGSCASEARGPLREGSTMGATEKSASCLVAFRDAPYPLRGNLGVPGTGRPFFEQDPDGRLFHLAPRGGKLYANTTYADPRSLLVVPGRRAGPPRALVLFLHGNLATLTRDVIARQKVVAQFERSRLDAVLVAPQLATDANDSSPGRFYERGFLDSYLAEAAEHLARCSDGRLAASQIDSLPLILVAYSGGYLATAFALPEQSGTNRRIAGVILLDALFGEEEKFARWIERSHADAFFVSAYSPASTAQNAKLAADLKGVSVAFQTHLPPALRPGDIVLLAAPKAAHVDFVTDAWVRDPLEALLGRVKRRWSDRRPERAGEGSPGDEH